MTQTPIEQLVGPPKYPVADEKVAEQRKLSWDHYFLYMAKLTARRSKDPSTKVGAVLVDENKRIVSTGFNGFPQNTFDNTELYQDRARKNMRVIHAEMNAILFADRKGLTLYCTHPPCAQCMAAAIQAGIKRVVHEDVPLRPTWEASVKEARALAYEAFVEVEIVPCLTPMTL